MIVSKTTAERAAPGHSRKLAEIGRIVNSVRRMLSAVDCYSHQLKSAFGITGPQLGALRLVDRHPQMPLGELSGQMYLHISTVSGIVDRLESGGYLTRRRSDDDRRNVLLQLTMKGKRTIAQAPPSSFGAMLGGLERLPLGELRRMNSALQKLSLLMQTNGGRVTTKGQVFRRRAPRGFN